MNRRRDNLPSNFKDGRSVARRRYQNRQLWQATVKWLLEDELLFLEVDVSERHQPARFQHNLVGIGGLPRSIDRAELHAEVVRNNGRKGLTMRLIRVGYGARDGQPQELAEFAFCLPKAPIKLMLDKEYEIPRVPDTEELLNMVPAITPGLLVDLFTSVRECVVFVGPHPVRLHGLYCRGRVHLTRAAIDKRLEVPSLGNYGLELELMKNVVDPVSGKTRCAACQSLTEKERRSES